MKCPWGTVRNKEEKQAVLQETEEEPRQVDVDRGFIDGDVRGGGVGRRTAIAVS